MLLVWCFIHLILFFFLIYLSIKDNRFIILFLLHAFIFHKNIEIAILLISVPFSDEYHTLKKVYERFGVEIDNSKLEDGVIYVANYPYTDFYSSKATFLNYFTFGLLNSSILFGHKKPKKFLDKVLNKNTIIYIDRGNQFESVEKVVKDVVKKVSIIVYPRKSFDQDMYDVDEFRTGIFRIAEKNKIKVIPIAIENIKFSTFGYIPDQKLKIVIGDEVKGTFEEMRSTSYSMIKESVKSFYNKISNE